MNINLVPEQIDLIVIDELKSLFSYETDKEILNAALVLLEYYMLGSDFENFVKENKC